ncbi:MAG TPA: ATP-dependent protease LonB [Candidatus Norongarragalinales archaeon]|nr:ATP-dependent protease LonB [Candidatus Norongarragalinales archaeon]
MTKLKTTVKVKSTADVKVPERIVDRVIGQEKAVKIIKKAARQKRNVLLIGIPGTGKSMLAQAMSELVPISELKDILIYSNPEDENVPRVRVVKAGEGRKIMEQERIKAPTNNFNLIIILFLFLSSFFLLSFGRGQWGDVITAALLIGLFVAGGIMAIGMQLGKNRMFSEIIGPKLLIDNSDKKKAPFIEATGARAGSLLGDVRHDPFQSGGLGTPAHLRVEAGFVHKSNGGVLFIDEVSALSPRSQQELLTAMQEKKYPITGQSELSSGAQVRTEAVPCDFVLVAAGNYRDLQKMHPALRSRIRGYGYEVYMEDSIEDSAENEDRILQFIAQEIVKDGKIPHFDSTAIEEIIYEARKRSGRKNKLTLKLRDLGGLIRAAGDVAMEENAQLVSAKHVLKAKTIAQTLEQQMATQAVEYRKEYQVFTTTGAQVGKVNGLAVMGDSGVVLPIVAEVAPASSRDEAKIIATGKLGDIAKEAVENVSAIIKRHTGKDTSSFDIHIQFLQTYEGVEGDSASVSVATAVISALEEVAVKQDVALTGSLSVRGAVLPVGGITQKVEAAIDAGIKKAVIPYSNKDDVILSEEKLKKIQIFPAKDIYDVLSFALKEGKKKNSLLAKIKKEIA